jgi:hypothetical protein
MLANVRRDYNHHDGPPLEPSQRRDAPIGKPIEIEKSVWIAAGATIVQQSQRIKLKTCEPKSQKPLGADENGLKRIRKYTGNGLGGESSGVGDRSTRFGAVGAGSIQVRAACRLGKRLGNQPGSERDRKGAGRLAVCHSPFRQRQLAAGY